MTASPATSIAPGRNGLPGGAVRPASQAQPPPRKTAIVTQAAAPSLPSKRSRAGESSARRTAVAAPATRQASASGLRTIQVSSAAGKAASAESSSDGGLLGHLGAIASTIFGTNVHRGRLSTGQLIARNVTRSVTNQVVGGMVADIGKSVGGSVGGSVGRALVRGALGGLLRR